MENDVATLTAIVRSVVRSSNQSVEQLAEALGVRPATLYARLDPERPGARLGAEDLLTIMALCRNSAPLQWMLAEWRAHLERAAAVSGPVRATARAGGESAPQASVARLEGILVMVGCRVSAGRRG